MKNKDAEWADEIDRLVGDTAHWSGDEYIATVPVVAMMQMARRFRLHAGRAQQRECGVVARHMEILRNIAVNADLIPDPRMAELTDCYAVPLDDIEDARAATSEPDPAVLFAQFRAQRATANNTKRTGNYPGTLKTEAK